MDKMPFSILDSKLNDTFYNKKMKLNPSDDALLIGFNCLEKMDKQHRSRGYRYRVILLEIHYKYDRLNDMVELLNVIDKSKMVSYLQDNTTSTVIVTSTTHTTK